ncbi:MAG: type II secretion system F family protein, partial [Tepidisphaeraceae bacterium]
AAAMDHVIGQGLSPVLIAEQRGAGEAASGAGKKTPSTRVPQSAVENFTRELANLLAAGLSLSRSLHLLRREASHPGAKNVWSKIHDDVVGGTSLAESLGKWPKTFSTVYIAMVRAGEAGGFLPIVLQQIADFRTREQDLKGKVKAAMVYPCVLALLATAVLIFLMTFFIPRFSGIFEEFGSNLPWLTRAIVAVSGWLLKYGWLLAIAVVGTVFALRNAVTSESGRRRLERAVLHTPVLGTVAARFALVRFCRMLGTLVGAGVPLVASLRVARAALGNQTLSDAVNHAIEEVQRGQPLSRSLAPNALLFPPSVIEMISVAEETGRLDKELVRLSIAYEGELDRNLRMLVALAEPALLMVMASLIGTVVVGMLLPVFTLQDLIK